LDQEKGDMVFISPFLQGGHNMNPVIRDVKVICTAPEGINLVVVKVETSEPGLFGLGCATFAYRHLTVQHLIETYLKPLLIGRDVSRISELWQLMHQNAYWRTGPIVNNAISGVDMALWDIKGKMANMPVYDLFGGKVREGVPVYRHVDGADVSEICDNIDMYRSIGAPKMLAEQGALSRFIERDGIKFDKESMAIKVTKRI
jgi:L-alanine-DL-glutamate epimerase and related enzymes of enolase superfamily